MTILSRDVDGQGDDLPRQKAYDRIDCNPELTKLAEKEIGKDWKAKP